MENPIDNFFPDSPNWNQHVAVSVIGEPTLHEGRQLILNLDGNEVIIELFAEGLRLFSSASRPIDYGLIVNACAPQPLELQSYEALVVLSSEHWVLEISRQPFAFTLKTEVGVGVLKSADDGHFVRKHRIPPIARTSTGWLVSHALKSSEPVYGLGEKWSALNKRGQLIRSYNHDALGVNAEISYKNAPFCWSPLGWGVFINTPCAVTHSIGYAPWSQRSYSCLVESDHLDVTYFVSDNTQSSVNVGAQMLARYTNLTGRAPMPPLWSGGVILSKAYYADADEILSVAKQVRERDMPCDVITFDGRAWQDTRTRFAFEWDAVRYPNPKRVMDELKKMHFKVCVWEYPLISVEHPWFVEFAEKGWLLKDRRSGDAYQYEWDQQAFGEVLTPLPKSGIVDFTNPQAYAFWRDAHEPLFELGVDMIKADFGEQLEDPNMLAHNGESGQALHNVYAHLYNRCVYEAAEKYSKSGAFLFSRSAWTGSQRFNSQWGGDPQADWEGMMANVRGGLSWALTGAPFYATDVGGFYKDTRDDTLYVRWAQAGIFSAHFRLHGIGAREPWSYSDEACAAVMQALSLRYRLQRYLQKAMRTATETGLPVQRAMVLAFPEEQQSWSFENQFMFGDDILVAPCFDPDGHVELYLPHGDWVQFEPSISQPLKSFDGGRVHTFKLALHEMATFTRQGTQIPLNKDVSRTDLLSVDDNGDVLIDRLWPKQT